MEVNFIPENDQEDETLLDVPAMGSRFQPVQLKLSFLIRYPKNVTAKSFPTRLAAIAHPNLSPVIVAEETSFFLSLIYKMLGKNEKVSF